MDIRGILTKRLVFRMPDKHHALHRSHDALHATYLGAAAFHGGIYGYAALGLLILGVIGFFLGEELA